MKKNFGVNIAIIFCFAAASACTSSLVNRYFVKKDGIKTEGTVIYLRPQSSGYSKAIFYKSMVPVIRYMTKDGQSFQVTGCDSCYKVGDSVPIIYDRENPKNSIVNTRLSYGHTLYYAIGFWVLLVFFLCIKKKYNKN